MIALTNTPLSNKIAQCLLPLASIYLTLLVQEKTNFLKKMRSEIFAALSRAAHFISSKFYLLLEDKVFYKLLFSVSIFVNFVNLFHSLFNIGNNSKCRGCRCNGGCFHLWQTRRNTRNEAV